MNSTMKAVHPFEESGLGKAPFRYVGSVDQNANQAGMITIGHCGGAVIETKAGGTCDHCGKAIINMFRVQSADGNIFKVGCDCLKKVEIVNPRTLNADFKKAKDAKADARIVTARKLIKSADVRAELASKPHPQQWAANKGLTLLDWIEWILTNGGRSGRTDAAKVIERAAKKVEAE